MLPLLTITITITTTTTTTTTTDTTDGVLTVVGWWRGGVVEVVEVVAVAYIGVWSKHSSVGVSRGNKKGIGNAAGWIYHIWCTV